MIFTGHAQAQPNASHYEEALDCAIALYNVHLLDRTIAKKETTENSPVLEKAMDEYRSVFRFEGFRLGKTPDQIRADFENKDTVAELHKGGMSQAELRAVYKQEFAKAQRCLKMI